jgi:hypothetical protein
MGDNAMSGEMEESWSCVDGDGVEKERVFRMVVVVKKVVMVEEVEEVVVAASAESQTLSPSLSAKGRANPLGFPCALCNLAFIDAPKILTSHITDATTQFCSNRQVISFSCVARSRKETT